MSSTFGDSPPETPSLVIEELALDDEDLNTTGFLSFNLPPSLLDLNRVISCSCYFSFPKSVIMLSALRFCDSLIAVTLGCHSFVIHLKILLVQSWFEIVLPRFCNLFTMWVNLICMKEMVSSSSIQKSSMIPLVGLYG